MKSFKIYKDLELSKKDSKKQLKVAFVLILISLIGFAILGILFWLAGINPLSYFGFID